jgi:5'-3' exoribonuclease 2
MFDSVFDYTDKLIKIIKPKKLIYLAVDGVAPRAKMNQQRSRRFRAAQEAKEKTEKEMELLKDWEGKGLKTPTLGGDTAHGFDSNVITPGTTFMHRLAQAIKIYIAHRLQFDPLWKGLTVIFSDSNVPGEGEHKILEFIRLQRCNIFLKFNILQFYKNFNFFFNFL